jgi:hypothetical protein
MTDIGTKKGQAMRPTVPEILDEAARRGYPTLGSSFAILEIAGGGCMGVDVEIVDVYPSPRAGRDNVTLILRLISDGSGSWTVGTRAIVPLHDLWEYCTAVRKGLKRPNMAG